MATYENSITLARVFDGRDGADGGSGYSMSFSSEEILKIAEMAKNVSGDWVSTISYAPDSLKVKVLFGEEDFDDIENKLENMTVSVDYYGFDKQHQEWSMTNLQNSNIKTLGKLKEVTELTKQNVDKYNGLFYYSYAEKAFIFNTRVLNNNAINCYVTDTNVTAEDIRYKKTTELVQVPSGAGFDRDTIYYDDKGEQILEPNQSDMGQYYTKTIKYIEDTGGEYVLYQSQALKDLLDIIYTNDGFFKIAINFDGEKIENAFLMRMALATELAMFSVHASGINAAIANTKLNFDINGLTVTNGGLTIQNKKNENVFMADSEGNLQITGHIIATSGEFTGTIHAESGSFKGKIDANSGTIGGFTINEQSITAGENLQLISDTNGSKIIVKNIDIGAGAKIEDTLAIGGNVFLYNPDEHNGLVLTTDSTEGKNYTALYQNGQLRIASVTAPSWSVDETGLATFKKVKMNSAEIGTSVMSVDTVQAVGSSMVFKPSYTITTISNKDGKSTLTLQGANNKKELLSVDNIVLIANGQNFQYAKVTGADASTHQYTLDTALELGTYDTANDASKTNSICTNLGSKNNFVFTISSNISNETSLFKNNALALAEIDGYNLGTPSLKSRILLGSLDSLGENYFDKTGLYAENVYLNGSLTTKTDSTVVAPIANDNESSTGSNELNGTYAGINTLTGASFDPSNILNLGDHSRIVFWAGSESDSADKIQKAPFQITEEGTLYAQKGYFKGSIITEANITASKITAASFHGSTDNAALKLYDTGAGGIWFMNSNVVKDDKDVMIDKEDIASFIVDKDGFYIPSNNNTKNRFIKIETDSNVSINVNKITTPLAELGKINIDTDINDHGINFGHTVEGKFSVSGIINSDGTNLKIAQNENSYVNILNNQIALNSSSTSINNELIIEKTGASKLQYKIVENGCDLYVLEELKGGN